MKSKEESLRLAPERLRWICDPKTLPQVDGKKQAYPNIIGQDRALGALRMGLDIKLPGYHIFVTGVEGTGRTTTIRRVLEEWKTKGSTPRDLCYLFNFDNMDQPILLSFEAGQGRDFRRRLETMIASLRRHIPQLYRGENYQKRVSRLEGHYRQVQGEALRNFEQKVQQAGLVLVELQTGPYVRPELRVAIGDESYDIADLEGMVEKNLIDRKVAGQLQNNYQVLSDELRAVIRANARVEESFHDELRQLEQDVIRPLIHDTIEIIKSRFEQDSVNSWLDQVEEALLDEVWIQDEESDEQTEEPFFRYYVNLIVDNSKLKGAPVIIESTPSFQNLFGTIELRHQAQGPSYFDYRQIKAGSLIRAQGGTLVIMAQDLLEEGMVWPTLKRVLRNRELQIQAYDPQNRMVMSPLKPEAVALDVKVILVGDTGLYMTLLQGDSDLQRVFRIKVDFETDMPRNKSNMRRYLSFMDKVQAQDKLLPIDPTGYAAVLEFGARLSGRQDRLSTRFSSIVDVLIESDYFARKVSAKKITTEHVQKALRERVGRLGQTEQHYLKMFREGTLLLSTRGKVVGQVNGLFVLEQWDYAFGQPMRITASTSVGEGDILSIEREAEMSGSSFDKGHLILSGFLHNRFGYDKPLNLLASISCEQNYVGVDGDSATVTEIFALMSSLSGVPFKQGLAVTGSVNQFGEIQPVGGLNAKIEGFFRVCKDKGLSGEQGVIIPVMNVRNLMLDRELVTACREGKFHIYGIKTVDEGLELLSGLPAGKRSRSGNWTSGSLNEMVNDRLREMALTFKRFGDGPVK